MSFNSGTRSTMSPPFGPNAWRKASRQMLSSSSLLAEKRADKALEGLRESGIRNVTFVLVELT